MRFELRVEITIPALLLFIGEEHLFDNELYSMMKKRDLNSKLETVLLPLKTYP
jgi:hypothetical protein